MKLACDEYLPTDDADQAKSPVILLHGRLDSRRTWRKFGQEIADKSGRKVYALDARNHGESPWSDEMDLDILSDDVDQFMNERGISKAVLVGHSMGGKTAIIFALSRPDKVDKLFLEDIVCEGYSSTAKSIVGQIISLLRMSLQAISPNADEQAAKKAVYDYVTSFSQLGKGKGFMFDADTLPLTKTENGYQWQANLDVLEDMLKNRSSPTLSGVYEGDTLFLYGTKSFFDVEKDESIPKYFPRAVKVPVEGAGHLIHQDHPDVFISELLKFI